MTYALAARLLFFISVLRNGFVIIVLTLASWLYTRHRENKKGTSPIKILGTVPRGFQHVGVFRPNAELISALAGQLPVATIILLLEHIAISKCKYPYLSQSYQKLIGTSQPLAASMATRSTRTRSLSLSA